MLDTLTVDDFRPAVGQIFTIDGADAGTIELELTEASTLTAEAPATDAAGRRSPFHLLFRGPGDPVLAQQICRLENDHVGPLEIFIVPVARTADGADYQAIFT
jgi:hypothetical protein